MKTTYAKELEEILFENDDAPEIPEGDIRSRIRNRLEALANIERDFARHALHLQLAQSALKQIKVHTDAISASLGAPPVILGKTVGSIADILNSYKEQYETLADV